MPQDLFEVSVIVAIFAAAISATFIAVKLFVCGCP